MHVICKFILRIFVFNSFYRVEIRISFYIKVKVGVFDSCSLLLLFRPYISEHKKILHRHWTWTQTGSRYVWILKSLLFVNENYYELKGNVRHVSAISFLGTWQWNSNAFLIWKYFWNFWIWEMREFKRKLRICEFR